VSEKRNLVASGDVSSRAGQLTSNFALDEEEALSGKLNLDDRRGWKVTGLS
jgi:hypothetical protein